MNGVIKDHSLQWIMITNNHNLPFFYIISQLLKNQLVNQNHKPSIHSIDSMNNEYSLLNPSPNLRYGIKR